MVTPTLGLGGRRRSLVVDEETKGEANDDSQQTEDEFPLYASQLVEVAPSGFARDTVGGSDGEEEFSQDAKDIVLLDRAIENRAFGKGKQVLELFRPVAEKYAEALYLRDPVPAEDLLARVKELLAIYCDKRSVERQELSPKLLQLLEIYHRHSPNNMAVFGSFEDKPTKRRRLNRPAGPPANLGKLDLVNDYRMMCSYLKGAFVMFYEAGWHRTLLQGAAASRGKDWSAEDVEKQIKWLIKLNKTGGLERESQSQQDLREKLREKLVAFEDHLPLMLRFLGLLNYNVRGTYRRTMRDALLEAVDYVKPFGMRSLEKTNETWRQVAERINTRIGEKVAIFTSRACFDQYYLLRRIRLAGGRNGLIEITPNQAQLLQRIESYIDISAQVDVITPTAEDGFPVQANPAVEDPVEGPSEAAQAMEQAQDVESNAEEREALTLMLNQVDMLQPFQSGDREMFVWDKIRADVNYQLGKEFFATRYECLERVAALCDANRVATHPEIARLSSEQLELLQRIITQRGVHQETRNEDAARETTSMKSGSRRGGGAGGGRGRGRGRGGGRGRGRGRGRARGRGEGSGSDAREAGSLPTVSDDQPSEDTRALAQRLKQLQAAMEERFKNVDERLLGATCDHENEINDLVRQNQSIVKRLDALVKQTTALASDKAALETENAALQTEKAALEREKSRLQTAMAPIAALFSDGDQQASNQTTS